MQAEVAQPKVAVKEDEPKKESENLLAK